MANQIDAGRSRGRVRTLAGVLVGLSLLLVTAAEGSHTHDGDGGAHSPAACSVCELAHRVGLDVSAGTPGVAELDLVRVPAPDAHGLTARRVYPSPHRSRAPPLPISL